MFGSGRTDISSDSLAKLSALDTDRATDESLEGGRDVDESSTFRRIPRLRLAGMFALSTVLEVGGGNMDEQSSENDVLRMSSASSSEFTELKLVLRDLTLALNLLIAMVENSFNSCFSQVVWMLINRSCEMV